MIYTGNLVALFILTAITVGASYINFGSSTANVAIALTIATFKALLVAMIFMHLRWDKPVNSIAAVTGFLFLGIMLGFTLLDTDARRDPSPRNMTPMTDEQKPTPVPASMNPKLTPAPQPPAKEAKEGVVEGEAGHEPTEH